MTFILVPSRKASLRTSPSTRAALPSDRILHAALYTCAFHDGKASLRLTSLCYEARLEARRKAQRLRFQLVHDPVDFLARLAKQDRKAARKSGNVVLAATGDTVTDFGIAAQIAAAFITGAFYTTPTDFARQDSPQGVRYTETLRSSATTYHVAVTAALQADLPTLPHLPRTLAQTPSGRVKFYLKP